MKIKVSAYSSIMQLISSVVLFILGALLYTKPTEVMLAVTYGMGGLITLVGVFNCVKNYLDVKKDNSTSSKGMVIGIVLVVVGLVFIFLGEVIEQIIRFIIGGWILVCGITRLANALMLEKKDVNFWVLLVLSILLIGGGLYTILIKNLEMQIAGLILMAYAILEIFGHVFSRKQGISFEESTPETDAPKIDSNIKEAEVVDDNAKDTKKTKKDKKDKKKKNDKQDKQ